MVQKIQVLSVYGRVLGRDYHLLSRHEGVDPLLLHLLANLLLLETFFQIHLRRHPCEIGFALVGWLCIEDFVLILDACEIGVLSFYWLHERVPAPFFSVIALSAPVLLVC